VLRPMIRVACLMMVTVMASFALAQTQFSAEIVNNDNDKEGKDTTKVYFGKEKMRFDSMSNGQHGGGAVIMDLHTQTYTVLMADQHMYMEMPAQAMENRGMFTFFESGDVENACPEWLKLARNTHGTCHKVGHETVNGRDTVKYEGTNSEGESSTVWLDAKVRFPIKWQGKKDGGELRNIQEGSQPSSLFEIPAGFTKFDAAQMMQMRQQH